MTNSVAKSMSAKQKFLWLICLVVPVITYFLLEKFGTQIQFFMAITVFAILLMATEVVENFVPALMLPIAYILFDVVPAEIAFSGYTASTPWIFVGVFLLVGTLNRIGLLNRIAYRILIWTGGTYKGILIGLWLASFVLNFLLSGNAVIPILFLAYGVCLALNLKGTKTGVGICFASCAVGCGTAAAFYSPTSLGFVSYVIGRPLDITYFSYSVQNMAFLLVPTLVCIAVYFLYHDKTNVLKGKEYFAEELKKLGDITTEEKKVLLVLICIVIYMMTNPWHKLGMEWGFPLAAAILFLPGINVANKEDIASIPLHMILFVGACLCIGNVAVNLGIGQILAAILMPVIANLGGTAFVAITFVLTAIMNLLLTPFALMAVLPLPLATMADQLNINVLPVIYSMLQGLDAVFLPHESGTWLIAYSFGMMSMKDFVKLSVVKVFITFAVLLFVAVPVWKVLGLL